MARRKTDLEQLKGILDQFTPETIQRAAAEFLDRAYYQKNYRDFEDPGAEVEVGTDSRVNLEEIARMERIIAEVNLLPVHYLEEGAIVQRAVARVTLTEDHSGLPTGSGWGTGFLVSPSLFLTNNHVIDSEAFARKVEMQFNYQLDYKGNSQTVDTYSTDPDDVFYTNASLDFTLIRLNPRCWIKPLQPPYTLTPGTLGGEFYEAMMEYTPVPGGPLPRPPIPPLPPRPPFAFPVRPGIVLPGGPLRPPRFTHVCRYPGQTWGHLQLIDSMTYASQQHVNIIQHPRGRRKEVALQRNTITNIYTNRIRYSTDTEPGSSGSPVFNNEWDLISIHHAAGEWDNTSGAWVSNEGMRIDKIVADLRSHYSGTTTGQQILTELGI